MAKSIFKEIIIVLLIILAILLVLAILFYDYIPNNKVLPTPVQEYALQEDIKKELDQELNDMKSEEIVKTYQLDASDLENYERTKEYNKGKVNPFAQYSDPSLNTSTGNSNTTGKDGNTGSTNSNTSNNNQTTGTFLNTVGK